MRRTTILGAAGVTLAAAAGYVALRNRPRLAAYVIRHITDAEARRVASKLRRHVPAGVAELLDIAYAPGDPDAMLDVFYPAVARTATRLPTIVWIHGGGWVSGSKQHIANYARILASFGYTVVGVDYSIAPEHQHPTPVRQVNAALDYLRREEATLHVDSTRIVLAGDSGGAHIAAQLANAISVPSYARRLGFVPSLPREHLRGVLLYCGGYDMPAIDLDGPYGGFMKVMLWSYSGTRDFAHDASFATASIVNYVTASFPPAFISAGNADPLVAQSETLAGALAACDVPVTTLFFPRDHAPAVPHEYQFDLDSDAARDALRRSLKFLDSRVGASAAAIGHLEECS